jgi:hypothetical protein
MPLKQNRADKCLAGKHEKEIGIIIAPIVIVFAITRRQAIFRPTGNFWG